MAEYYIDLIDGNEISDGLSPDNAKKSYIDLDIKPGDKILFKRGTFVREPLISISGEEGKPITYGAYGEGNKPVFCGSMDLSDKNIWVEIDKNIWKCTQNTPTEAGNFIYDFGKSCGGLCWTREELSNQGEWFDNRAGQIYESSTGYCQFDPSCYKEEQELLIYSEKNPGEYYSHIECALYGGGRLAACDHDTVFEDLCFQGGGVHGICGAGKNITVKNCDFLFIGGAVIIKDEKVRFGNAIEFWEVCENCIVEGCSFHDIYDSGITHQGSINENIPKDNHFDKNFFSCCGMAAYECRNFVPVNTTFNDNVCMNAGLGFSLIGEELPRNSQIYPLPMGHHVFIWRIHEKTPGGSLQMKRNQFLNAPIGAAIFSMAPKEANDQIEIDENIYFTGNSELCNYFDGHFYETFTDYQKGMGTDKNGKELKYYIKEQ